MAESEGKDAADIFIILAIKDIAEVTERRETQITLLTNDHFG